MPQPRRTLTHAVLRDHLASETFRAGTSDRVGAEVELTPLAAADDGRPDVAAALAASDRLWSSWGGSPDGDGAIRWRGGILTREPGGQWEFSGAPFARPEETAFDVLHAVAELRDAARGHGFDFHAMGFHPWATAGAIGLRKRAPRYLAMQEHFDSHVAKWRKPDEARAQCKKWASAAYADTHFSEPSKLKRLAAETKHDCVFFASEIVDEGGLPTALTDA